MINFRNKKVVEGIRGSLAYKTNTINSDRDSFYIYTLTKDHYLGLIKGEESGQYFRGDLDVATFELRKWCQLINKQSPSILEQLWGPLFYQVDSVKPIFENKHKFLSKRIYNPFVKYAISLPADSKSRSHSVRLLTMCYETLTTGELVVERPDYQLLLDIKFGYYDPTNLVAELLSKCETALINTRLPDEPETDLLNKLCIDCIVKELDDY